ncbi:MAG: aminopeptidase P family protein [Muribaculaceae bacterium]|nr:aminopeptidase P family protein [Muribaculaceae bacterium]
MGKVNLEYLARLRKVMKDHGISATIVSNTDPHQSENPPAHWRGREWLTGFWSGNGTNGTAVVTDNKALCWTDSRFFIQATQQLEGTGFTMMKEDGPEAVDLIDWLVEDLKEGDTVGIDGMTFSVAYAQRIEQECNDNGIKLVTDFPLFDYIYPDRPKRPENKLFLHDESVVGETVDSKMSRLMTEVKAELANSVLISALDDIAWATNVRSTEDIAYSPIFVSYLYVDDNKRIIFVDESRIPEDVAAHFKKYNIEVRPYDSVLEFVASLPKDRRLLIDPEKTARGVYDKIACTPVFGGAGVARLKSIKNPVMLQNIETAMDKDGVALVKFFKYVEENAPSGQLTEVGLGNLLRDLRLADPACVDESFHPILGWNAHGAIVHYEATDETDFTIEGDGLLLVDSGGQYSFGTTDITRTVAVGTPTADQKRDFTLVLKGHIALSCAKFPEGTRGAQLDVLARQYLWADGKAYYHGTGHGVGFFINCHEGPQSIRLNENPARLEPGMITSNEPGIYLEDKYGIRTENLIVVEPWITTDFGPFFRFKTLTMYPYDKNLIDLSLMTDDEIRWVNDYHKEVFNRLSPHLDNDEKRWLEEKTSPLRR